MFRITQNMALTTFALLGRDDLHLGASMIGVLGALSGLALVAVTIGVAARVPARSSTAEAAAGMVVLVAALVAFILATSLPVLFAAVLLLGVAGGLGMPGLTNAVGVLGRANREQAVGLYTLTLSVSLAVGPLLETFVLDRVHQAVRAPFLAFLAFPVLGALALAAGVRRHRREPALHPTPPDPTTPGTTGHGTTGPNPAPPHPTHPSVEAPVRHPGLLNSPNGRLALTARLLYAIPFAGISVFGALIAHVAFATTPAQAQLAFTAFFVTSLISRALVAWRAPIQHKLAFFWLSGALTAAGLALLGTGHGLAMLLVAMAILGVPHGLTFPLVLALVASSASPAELPRANAALLATGNLTAVLVPVILGSLVTLVGYRSMVLLILVPVAVCAALLWTQRPSPRAALGPPTG